MEFSYDFHYEIKSLEKNECFKINDNQNFEYKNQFYSQMYDMDYIYIGKKINNPDDKYYKDLQTIVNELDDSRFEKREHMKLIEYLIKQKIFNFSVMNILHHLSSILILMNQ